MLEKQQLESQQNRWTGSNYILKCEMIDQLRENSFTSNKKFKKNKK